jgi:hypothetical protein
MPIQYTQYGFPYPQPADPVRDGAAAIGQLAGTLKAPELFSGQPCLAGALPAGQNWRVRQVVYNYSPGTDTFGLLAIPLPFTVVCVTAVIMPRNFRQNVVTVALAQEYCTVTNLAAYPRNAAGDGVGSTNCDLAIIAWGY